MSTKCTVMYDDNFHFYEECFDKENIYLEIDDCEFEADKNSCTIAIPLEIWENIRKCSVADLSLVDKTDEDIFTMVTEDVDGRIAAYQEAATDRAKALVSMAGGLLYGDAADLRQEQIDSGIRWYLHEKQRQQDLKTRMDKIAEKNQRALKNKND